jgi:hypothetical protein
MMMIEDVDAMDRIQAGTWAAWDFGMDMVEHLDSTPDNDRWYN